jgi:hypothetical protein
MADHPKTFQQLWRTLGSDRRKAAANALLAKGDRTQQTLVTNLIAMKLKFRPHKAAQLPPERKAHYVATMDYIDDGVAGALVRDYLFAQQRPMLSRFLDSLGIPHKDGEIEEKADIPKPAHDALKTALGTIRGEFNADEVAIYTNALALSDPDFWGELRTVSDEPQDVVEPSGKSATAEGQEKAS